MTTTATDFRASLVSTSRRLKTQSDLLDQYVCESDYLSALGQMHLIRSTRLTLEGLIERAAKESEA